MRHLLKIAAGLGLAAQALAQVKAPTNSAVPPVTIAFEFAVQDARGRPVTDLRLEEVEVVQDATKQQIKTFRAGARSGLYEVTYVPYSGKPAGVAARVTRPGTVISGPDGGALKPRLISALSPLEAELTGYLEAQSGASDLACDVATYRFESGPKGTRHTIAVEIPLHELRFERTAEGNHARLQILARITPLGQRDARQHLTLEQVVEAEDSNAVGIQRLVWTGTAVLGSGPHTIDVLVRDPTTAKATTKTVAVEVPPVPTGLTSSSVVLLRPREFFFLRDRAEGDDPLVSDGVPLMPALSPVLFTGVSTHLRFFVALYPAAGLADSVDLRAEVLRDGTKLGEAAIALPKSEPNGEIRYVGEMATRSFREGAYVLRLVARQGAASVAQEAAFTISTPEPTRLGPQIRR